MSNTDTGKQGGAPALPNNFSASTPTPADITAPDIGGSSQLNVTGPASKSERGKDGTQF